MARDRIRFIQADAGNSRAPGGGSPPPRQCLTHRRRRAARAALNDARAASGLYQHLLNGGCTERLAAFADVAFLGQFGRDLAQ
jgi:hypothetical protein